MSSSTEIQLEAFSVIVRDVGLTAKKLYATKKSLLNKLPVVYFPTTGDEYYNAGNRGGDEEDDSLHARHHVVVVLRPVSFVPLAIFVMHSDNIGNDDIDIEQQQQ